MSYDAERGNGNGPRKSYQTGGFGSSSSNGNGNNKGNPGNGGNAGSVEHPLVSSIKENIKQMSANVTLITKFITTLGTNKDTQDLRNRLSGTIESTKQIAKETAVQLKELHTTTTGTPDQRNQMKQVHQKLAKDFSVWLEKFQEISKLSAQKERTLLPPKNPAPSNTPKQLDTFPNNPGYNEDVVEEKQSLLEASRKQQLLQIENEREFNDSIIQDREEGIKKIEGTIREVNEIFTDLAQLVNEQGIMIDNIESNIESTAHNTAEGVVELRKASDHQKSSRNKLCCLALIIAVVAALVVGAVVLAIKL